MIGEKLTMLVILEYIHCMCTYYGTFNRELHALSKSHEFHIPLVGYEERRLAQLWRHRLACMYIVYMYTINPLTSVSHCSGFKVKLAFHGIQFFGSSLYTS